MSSSRCPESNDLAPQTKLGMFRHCISPYAEKSDAGKGRRRSGWETLDMNDSGLVSLTELDR